MADLVEEHWPHVAELHRMLEAIAGHRAANVGRTLDAKTITEMVLNELNAAGGPQLRARAVSSN